jgi:hypothetical protein
MNKLLKLKESRGSGLIAHGNVRDPLLVSSLEIKHWVYLPGQM